MSTVSVWVNSGHREPGPRSHSAAFRLPTAMVVSLDLLPQGCGGFTQPLFIYFSILIFRLVQFGFWSRIYVLLFLLKSIHSCPIKDQYQNLLLAAVSWAPKYLYCLLAFWRRRDLSLHFTCDGLSSAHPRK